MGRAAVFGVCVHDALQGGRVLGDPDLAFDRHDWQLTAGHLPDLFRPRAWAESQFVTVYDRFFRAGGAEPAVGQSLDLGDLGVFEHGGAGRARERAGELPRVDHHAVLIHERGMAGAAGQLRFQLGDVFVPDDEPCVARYRQQILRVLRAYDGRAFLHPESIPQIVQLLHRRRVAVDGAGAEPARFGADTPAVDKHDALAAEIVRERSAGNSTPDNQDVRVIFFHSLVC